MRKIKNPFVDTYKEDYHCFGCSPHNKIGLNLSFYEKDGTTIAEWKPDRNFEGYHNVLHGGIQATMHDEIASWAVYTQCDTAGVTSNMNVTYHRPVYMSNEKITLRAVIRSTEEKKAVIETELLNDKGQVCSSAVVEYFLFPPPIAARKYYYPGKDAFFEK